MSVAQVPFPSVVAAPPIAPAIMANIRATPIHELQVRPSNDESELLRHRYLCKGGGMLLVGPTGIGKSSFSMQCMIQWALGKPAFEVHPTRPLKSLLIQAENDEGDLAEMRDGMLKGLELSEQESQALGSMIFTFREDSRTREAFFREIVEPLVEAHKPDLLWIDPALAYLGGESNSQEDVGKFLRNLLNPLINRHQCGVIVVHHTNKPFKAGEASGGGIADMAYQGTGSAEWANWARAVMVLKSTRTPGIFELHAGKRGARIRWRDTQANAPVYVRHLTHAKGDGEIYWRFATQEEVAGNSTEQSEAKVRSAIVGLVPPIDGIEKGELVERCKDRNIGRDRAYKTIKDLVGVGELLETEIPRPNARPVKQISRQTNAHPGPQPLPAPTTRPPTPPKGLSRQPTEYAEAN